MKSRVIELHYSIAELAFLYRFSETTIREFIRREKFGPLNTEQAEALHLGAMLNVGGNDVRVPASRCLFFEAHNTMERTPGIAARNKAELVRKLAGKHEEATHG